MTEDTYALVLTTVATEALAEALAQAVVELRLAACVQIQSIRSVCRWKGEMCRGPEFLLIMKTTDRRYAALEAYILANHAYETPQIVRLPIEGGSRAYLDWIGASVG